MVFVVQVYRGNRVSGRWEDVKDRRNFELARGDAWALSQKKSEGSYGALTRVIIRSEAVLCRFGQLDRK